MPFKIRKTHFLSVLIDRVRRPLATVRVAPLYWLCGRVAYLHVAFPCHIGKVCEFWKDFSVWILLNFQHVKIWTLSLGFWVALVSVSQALGFCIALCAWRLIASHLLALIPVCWFISMVLWTNFTFNSLLIFFMALCIVKCSSTTEAIFT